MSNTEKFENQIKILDSKLDFVHHENRDLFQSFSDLSKAILQAFNEKNEDFNKATQKMRTIHSHFKNKEVSYLKQISELQEVEKHEETTELPKANEFDEKLKTLRSQNNGLQSQVEQLDSQNTKLKNIILQCVGKDKELQSSLGPLIDEISELKEDVRRAKQENDSYSEDKVKSLVKENSQLKEILKECEGKLNDLQGQKVKLVGRNERMSNRIINLIKKNEEFIKELENSESNDSSPDNTQEIVSLKQKIAHLQETNDKVTSDLNTCLDEKKLIEQNLSAKNNENLSLKQENSQFREIVEEISRTRNTYKDVMKRLQENLQEQGEDSMQNGQILKLKQENQKLKEDFDNCQRHLNNVKYIIQMEKMGIKNKLLEAEKFKQENEQLQAHIQHLETEIQKGAEYLSEAKSCLTKAEPAEACPNCVKLEEDFQAGYQSLTAELEALKNENKDKTQEIKKKQRKIKDMSDKMSDYQENKREIEQLKETCSSLKYQISFYENKCLRKDQGCQTVEVLPNKCLIKDKGCQTVELIADPEPAEACPNCVKLEEDFQAGYQSLTAELETLKNENKDKTQEIEKKQRKIKDMSDKMSDYRENKRKIEQLKETCSSLKYQISFYEKKCLIKDKGCQTVELIADPEPAEACPNCVKLEEDFQAGYQSLTAELETLKNENKDKTQEIEKKQRKIKDMSDKMSDYRENKREIEQLKETCSSLKYQISFYEKKCLIKDKGCQTVELIADPEPAEACPNCVKLEEDFQAGYQSLTAELETLKNENKDKTQEIEKKQRKIKNMSDKMSDYRENEREIQRLKETCSSLKYQISFYEKKCLIKDKGCQTVELIADPEPAEACPNCVKLEEDFQVGYQSLAAELETLKNENKDKTQEIEKKQRKIKDMSDKMSDYRENKREIQRLQETCSSLEYFICMFEYRYGESRDQLPDEVFKRDHPHVKLNPKPPVRKGPGSVEQPKKKSVRRKLLSAFSK